MHATSTIPLVRIYWERFLLDSPWIQGHHDVWYTIITSTIFHTDSNIMAHSSPWFRWLFPWCHPCHDVFPTPWSRCLVSSPGDLVTHWGHWKVHPSSPVLAFQDPIGWEIAQSRGSFHWASLWPPRSKAESEWDVLPFPDGFLRLFCYWGLHSLAQFFLTIEISCHCVKRGETQSPWR